MSRQGLEYSLNSRRDIADVCLHELVERQARRREALAVRSWDKKLTLGELNRRANWLAHHLHDRGIRPGDRVGVHLERSSALVVALLGILKSGGAFIPLDRSYPRDRLTFMISNAEPAAIITENPLALADEFPGLEIIDLSGCEQCDDNPRKSATPTGTAYIMYTSGSTGRPKGVIISHRAIVNNIQWMQSHFQIRSSDRILQKTEISFDPSMCEIFVALATGARLVIPHPDRHRDPAYVTNLMRDEGVTVLNCVPTFLSLLLDSGQLGTCTSLRHCFCGGEAMSPELVRRFEATHAAQLHNMYGPTEVTITSLSYSVPRGSSSPVIPIGKPAANVKAFVFDNKLQQVPPGAPGELYLGGLQLADGYHGRPDLTAERFIDHEFDHGVNTRLFATGDKVRIRPDGNFEFLGRLDEQIKFRGFRIEPAEIEAALRLCPNVRNVVVMLKRDTTADVQLVAYVQPNAPSTLKVSVLRLVLREKLPAYMVPTQFIVLDTFPLTPNGKIDRDALPPPNQAISTHARPITAGTRTELELSGIWTSVLGIQDIDVKDNFFEIGGYSLKAVHVVSQIKKKLGVDIGLGDVFSFPTIEQLSKRVDAARGTGRTGCTIYKTNRTVGQKAIHFVGSDFSNYRLGQLLEGCFSTFTLEARLPAAWRTALKTNEFATNMQQLVEPFVAALFEDTQVSDYVLVGHSFGGKMAFEIGHQLQKHGRSVEAVILLDARLNRLNLLDRWLNRWKRRSSILRHVFKATTRQTGTNIAPSSIFDDNGEMLPWDVVVNMFRIIESSYRAQPIDTRGVLLIGAKSDHFADCDKPIALRSLFRRGLDIISVPGDHISMIRDEGALKSIALELSATLQVR
jgi:amino acid adenylation domain-containing protein